ncbi:MAG: aminopeptidase, partial [Terracidiphilus sp.]
PAAFTSNSVFNKTTPLVAFGDKCGILYNNTLFDENAASHIALGQSYSSCLQGGDKLTPDQLAARGANDSLIHVDWMIGSGKLDIDGETATGSIEPLMRQGEWV